MKAMILAAGYGTRLRPLTDSIPKALIPLGSGTMISYQILKLKESGISEIIVNAHHLYEKIVDYFEQNSFGMKIDVIIEKEILGTGGAVLNAKEYLKNEKEFLVLNTDVYTDFKFENLAEEHRRTSPAATLAVQKRLSGRYLEFDDEMYLIGRKKSDTITDNFYAFNGIHIISGEIYKMTDVTGYIDIIDLYTGLIDKDIKIKGYDTGNCLFRDLGKPENLKGLRN